MAAVDGEAAANEPKKQRSRGGAAAFFVGLGILLSRVAGLIREPRAEIYTNPASADLARSYIADVQGFEARLTSGPTA